MFRIFIAAVCVLFSTMAHAAPVGPVPETLVIDSNAPPIQMLVPGFTVTELGLGLHNINSLVCAPDGRIFALAYDGNVLQLTDSNATYFYKNEHDELPASIGMAWGPGGLYIASRGRIFRLRDKGDGAGELQTIAGGWPFSVQGAGSALDAVGLAVDRHGAVYFGLGCDNWLNPYVTNSAGKSQYHLDSPRGTIQKLSPDWKHRETVATGVRFTVCLAFNAEGDLFATDQEGATWLANGNPFDELLFIQPGRHYGFPPRHPVYLPNVIDEPSVFDYAPQHQSTCGVHFDLPAGGGTNIFGPAWWRDDAIVSGESRGKLWRTKLVKTPSGYVAQNNLIACLQMLTIDAIPTPPGDLLVTCHSGKPDWGSGPEGMGKLFRIRYSDPAAPQPALTYASGEGEFSIVFDRPLNPEAFTNLAQRAQMEMGKYVVAGNRFEAFRPGYAAVERQSKVPRYRLPVLSAGLSADNRTIILRTVPSSIAVNYALTIPNGAGAIDVACDLSGVEASWRAAGGKTEWSGWLPDFDLTVDKALTAPSAEHQRLFDLLGRRGTLELQGQLDLWSMLHPAVQPGEKLSFTYPPEKVTVIFRGGEKLKLTSDIPVQRINATESRITVISRQGQWAPIRLSMATGRGPSSLDVSWFTDEDPRPRAMALRRILVPWARPDTEQPPSLAERQIPEIKGGDWQRGKKLFFSDLPGCYKCHEAGGNGGKIGPDLSNLIYRDYASVMKDIVEPSAAINPDHLAYNIELTDGDIETGVILADRNGVLTIGQASGQSLDLPRSRIVRIKPSSISLMPEGLLKGLSASQQRDLLTFLLTAPASTRSAANK